jgi:hypothetical protein
MPTRFGTRMILTVTLLIFVALAATSLGQVATARLDGVVKDVTDAILPGVTVIATNTGTTISFTSISNDTGRYTFVSLTPGVYDISAELSGFKRHVTQELQLKINDVLTLDITMQIGEVTEEVIVESTAALVDQTSTRIGSVVQRDQILDLPLNGRNPMDLFKTVAGTTPLPGSGRNNGSVDGLRSNSNNVHIEGVWANDASYDSSPARPFIPTPLEAVGEYSIATSSTSLENGRGAGAQVSLIFKSGTNDFHGSLYEFNRNTSYNANNWFNNRQGNERPVFKRHQFGYSVGGPIWKGRTFFFTTTEWSRESQAGISNRIVYTPELRGGIFRYYTAGGNSGSLVDGNGNPTVPAGDIGSIDLLTVDPTRLGLDPTGRVAAVFAATPTPNNYDIGDGFNTAGFRFNAPDDTNGYQYLIKVDHKLDDQNQIRGTWTYAKNNSPDADSFPGLFPRFPNDFYNQGGMFGWTTTFSPNFINEFTAGGYARESFTQNGHPGSKDIGGIYNLDGLGDRGSRGGGSNGNLIGVFQDQRNPIVSLSFSNNMSWIRGNHSYKWGFELVRSSKFNWFGGDNYIPIIDTEGGSNPATIPSLPGLHSTDANLAEQLTNDLTGSVGHIEQQFHVNFPVENGYNPYDTRYRRLLQPEYGMFFQDTWKMRPNLTFNYGVRWDLLTPSFAIDGVYTYPEDGPRSVLGPTASRWFPAITPNGRYQTDFAPDKGKGQHEYDWNNFSPSIGFVWDPTGSNKTSISANFRVAHDRHMISTYSRFEDQNQGLSIEREISPVPGTRFGDAQNTILPIAPPPMLFPLLPDTRTGRAYAFNPTIRTPYTESWTLRIQRELSQNWQVEVAYVGNIGVGGWRAINVNQMDLRRNGFLAGYLQAQANLDVFGNPNVGGDIGILNTIFGPMGGIPSSQYSGIRRGEMWDLANFADTTNFNGVRGGLLSATGLGTNFLRGTPQVVDATIADNLSVSTYHGLKMQVNRRFSDGLYFHANYVWGKALSDFEGGQGQYDDFRDNDARTLDKTFLRYDARHVVKFNTIYHLPFGGGKKFGSSWNGVVDAILGGWQFTALYAFTTAQPLTITTNYNLLTDNDTATPNFSGTSFNFSNITKGASQVTYLSQAQEDLFSTPAPGSPGGIPQRSIRGPGYTQLDVAFMKNFNLPLLGEDGRIQFRAEFFNMPNLTNWNSPSGSGLRSTSGNFGRITSSRDARIGQIALKIIF